MTAELNLDLYDLTLLIIRYPIKAVSNPIAIRPIAMKTSPIPPTIANRAAFLIINIKTLQALEQKPFPDIAILLDIFYISICVFVEESDKSFETG